MAHLQNSPLFQSSSFADIIEGFLTCTGLPGGVDNFGFQLQAEKLGYPDFNPAISSPGFRPQLFYHCATATDSLMQGQNVKVMY